MSENSPEITYCRDCVNDRKNCGQYPDSCMMRESADLYFDLYNDASVAKEWRK